MQLKELIDAMEYGTHYKLIGAKTGKHLADSAVNKTTSWHSGKMMFSDSFLHLMHKKIISQKFRHTLDLLFVFG